MQSADIVSACLTATSLCVFCEASLLTLVLSGVIWLVQALNLIDKALTAGTSPMETLMLSSLVLPRVLTFTLAPHC